MSKVKIEDILDSIYNSNLARYAKLSGLNDNDVRRLCVELFTNQVNSIKQGDADLYKLVEQYKNQNRG